MAWPRSSSFPVKRNCRFRRGNTAETPAGCLLQSTKLSPQLCFQFPEVGCRWLADILPRELSAARQPFDRLPICPAHDPWAQDVAGRATGQGYRKSRLSSTCRMGLKGVHSGRRDFREGGAPLAAHKMQTVLVCSIFPWTYPVQKPARVALAPRTRKFCPVGAAGRIRHGTGQMRSSPC